MAEISIDQSKLPGVKEVCRDFAVLEDHTLAHSLQEQEIEHHLATNVQRNRLVQYDLQMARQLQEEEDRKARARIQERHKDLERQDCEIAQEIQVKLVIEAEQRRRQEEDDEDIARILQQKELQEEKRRKKPHPEPLQKSPYEEGYYPESRERSCGSPREQARPRPARSPREPRGGPPLFSEGLDLEVLGSSSEVRQAGGGQRDGRERQDRKRGGRERPRRPPSDTEECGHWDGGRSNQRRETSSQERLWRPSSLARDGEVERPRGNSMGQRERRPRSPEGRHRTPPLPLDWEETGARLDGSSRPRKRRERRSPSSERTPRPPHLSADMEERRRYGHSCSPDPDRQRRPAHQDRESPRPPSRDPRLQDQEAPAPQRGRRRDGARDRHNGASASPSSHGGEDEGADTRRQKDPGTKPRGTKEATYHKSRPAAPQEQESYDAEIARKLQEEELLASQVDKRAAQVAQDEEIARLLLAEEKKAYKKAKEREKSSLEKKRQEPDWKHDTHDTVRPRSREGHEGHRSRSDKPTRPPPPPSEDLDHLCNLTSQHNLAHQTPRPEPSQKGYHYKH